MKVILLTNIVVTIIILLISLAHVVASATCSSGQNFPPYELVFMTDDTTEQTGSITLKYQDGINVEEVEISEIKFSLNRSSPTSPSLRERGDLKVIELGRFGIKFNLTRKYEGYYTCGRRVDCAYVKESMPMTLISLQTIIPLLPPPQTNFTATSGDEVVLPCQIQPGALLQQYSVTWMKGNISIVNASNPQSITTVDDSQYEIDDSLIINSVTVNDTSAHYQCELTIVNPQTNTKQVLHPSSPGPASVSLSLKVIENMPTDNSSPDDRNEESTYPSYVY